MKVLLKMIALYNSQDVQVPSIPIYYISIVFYALFMYLIELVLRSRVRSPFQIDVPFFVVGDMFCFSREYEWENMNDFSQRPEECGLVFMNNQAKAMVIILLYAFSKI